MQRNNGLVNLLSLLKLLQSSHTESSVHFVQERIFSGGSVHFVQERIFSGGSVHFVQERIFSGSSVHFVQERIFSGSSVHFVQERIFSGSSVHFVQERIFTEEWRWPSAARCCPSSCPSVPPSPVPSLLLLTCSLYRTSCLTGICSSRPVTPSQGFFL
jgi:hypothetical protein